MPPRITVKITLLEAHVLQLAINSFLALPENDDNYNITAVRAGNKITDALIEKAIRHAE